MIEILKYSGGDRSGVFLFGTMDDRKNAWNSGNFICEQRGKDKVVPKSIVQ